MRYTDDRARLYDAWKGNVAAEGFLPPTAAGSWRVCQHVGPSALYGANGMNWGADGRLYVAQGAGNRVSALDNEGNFETILPVGSPLTAPDDLVFDSSGEMFVTDVGGGAVWRRSPDGKLNIVAAELPAANGIAIKADRLFINECREGGRLMELDRYSGEARVILSDLPAPNGMAFGPDGRLYFPLVFKGEVWAVDVESGQSERILGGLAIASAVKISPAGKLAVTSSATGIITQLDLCDGTITEILARPGFDNLLFDQDNRLFVSYFSDGGIAEILGNGQERLIAPRGLIAPTAIAISTGGVMFIADSALKTVSADRTILTVATYTDPGFPGKLKGLCGHPDGRIAATTVGGDVTLYDTESGVFEVIITGLQQPAGIACENNGQMVVVETQAGRVLRVSARGVARVLAEGLKEPNSVALSPSGRCFVTEAQGGRIIELSHGSARTFAEGFDCTGGIAASETHLFVLLPSSKSLAAIDLRSGRVETIVRGLPLRAPPAARAGMTKSAELAVGATSSNNADPDGVLAKANAVAAYHIGIAWDQATGAIYVPTDADGAVLTIVPVAQQ